MACNFDLSNWSILAQIKHVLLPHSNKEVLAQLDKVNLYTAGGFFKPHQDTPRSKAMFGSLVLCLPSQFQGGELLIHHRSGQKVYDWGQAAQDTRQIQWAAFYSDCTHEILPVTDGVRVTVTYNLFVDEATAREQLNAATTTFSDDLAAALRQPGFLKDGGILGFACEHAYPRDQKVAGLTSVTLAQIRHDQSTVLSSCETELCLINVDRHALQHQTTVICTLRMRCNMDLLST